MKLAVWRLVVSRRWFGYRCAHALTRSHAEHQGARRIAPKAEVWYVRTMPAERVLETALGYLELGLPDEALSELQSLAPRERMSLGALEIKLAAEMKACRWNAGADTSRLLCMREPRESRFFIHAACCLHQTGDTEAARNWLLTGPSELIEEPLFHYNIACYHAVLGEEGQARSHLRRAFSMDGSLHQEALHDDDLAGLSDLAALAAD